MILATVPKELNTWFLKKLLGKRLVWKIFQPNGFWGTPPLMALPKNGLEAVSAQASSSASATSTLAGKSLDYAKTRLHIARLISSEDDVRHGALRKFREIVVADPFASHLGRMLLNHAGALLSEDKLRMIFEDTFASKSTATLVKRCSSLWKFHPWIRSNGGPCIFSLDEPEIYKYVCYLRASKSAPTSGQSFLQSLAFLFHLADVDKQRIASIHSARVRGCVNDMMKDKHQLKQAVCLTTDAVYFLQSLMRNLQEDHLKVILGHLLLCIYSCSRFAGSVFLDEITVANSRYLFMVETASKRYKMGVREKKQKFLPLATLGQGLFHIPWAVEWIMARNRCLPSAEYSLPAWSQIAHQWADR